PRRLCGVAGRPASCAALPDRVERAAAGLAALDVGKGDVCAILAPNSPEYVVAVRAIARLGAVATTANPLYTPDALVKQLRDSGASVLLTTLSLRATWAPAIEGTAGRHVVALARHRAAGAAVGRPRLDRPR